MSGGVTVHPAWERRRPARQNYGQEATLPGKGRRAERFVGATHLAFYAKRVPPCLDATPHGSMFFGKLRKAYGRTPRQLSHCVKTHIP